MTRTAPPSKTYLLYFAAAFLGTVSLLAFFLWNAQRQANETVEVAMKNMVATMETGIDASLRRLHADLEHIATELPAVALEQRHAADVKEQVLGDINHRARHFPELHSFRIYDANGDDLFISGPVVPRHNVADRAYFQCAKAKPQISLCYSEAIIGKITKKPVVVIAKPLIGADGQFRGIVAGTLEMRYITDFFSTLDLGKSGAIALRRSEDGALVARWPDTPEALNMPFKPSHPLQTWLKSHEREGSRKITAQTDGVERFYVYRRLADYPFFIISGRASQEYLTPWRQTAQISLGFSAIALLVLALTLRHQWRLRQQEMQHMRELALARDAAEAASRAKSTFLANMSHELRTPMNAIMGMTDLVLRHTTDPKLQEQLGKVTLVSQHLLHVINNILDISKIEAEHLTLERASFQLGEVLENLTSLIGHKILDKGLTLHIELTPEAANLTLLGDPLRLGQILLNLTGNALKFTEQGSITVRAQLAENHPAEVLLRFEVADSGIGIAPADQARLFTAFEQADGSMTRKYGGTGLGLAISKRLAKLMGGEIGVTSVTGQGSTFWFTARLGKASMGGAAGADDAGGAVPPAPTFARDLAEARIKSRHASARILLAEDEPINQEVSRGLLEDAGLTVDLAEDGAQAVAMAKLKHYDLILMDMQMPHLNGIDATRIIRTLPGYARTPILAMTANAFDEDRQACIGAGMNDHIGKPVNPDLLFETLLRWLADAHDEPA